jgi:hypothetical protein
MAHSLGGIGPTGYSQHVSRFHAGVIVVISVNSSGRICGWLRERLPEGGTIVVVCQTSKDETPCHHTLTTLSVNRSEPHRCDLCQRGSRALHIDPQTYELVPKIEYTGVKVNKEVATAKADFWTMANEADAVELHKTIAYPGKRPGAPGTSAYCWT